MVFSQLGCYLLTSFLVIIKVLTYNIIISLRRFALAYKLY